MKFKRYGTEGENDENGTKKKNEGTIHSIYEMDARMVHFSIWNHYRNDEHCALGRKGESSTHKQSKSDYEQ